MSSNGITHEDKACQLLQVADKVDTSDEWGQNKKAEIIAEATAHGNLAIATSLNKILKALENKGPRPVVHPKGSW